MRLLNLGITANKKRSGLIILTVFAIQTNYIRLKTYGFLDFIVFCFLSPFSCSTVHLYAYVHENEDFCSKSNSLQGAFALRIL